MLVLSLSKYQTWIYFPYLISRKSAWFEESLTSIFQVNQEFKLSSTILLLNGTESFAAKMLQDLLNVRVVF